MTRFDATDRRPVDKWTAAPRPTTSPQGQQPQQKRSTHMVHKPVNSECSRQLRGTSERKTLYEVSGLEAAALQGIADQTAGPETTQRFAGLDWVSVLPESELPAGARKVVERNEFDLLLIRTASTVYATNNACPHLNLPLNDSEVTSDGVIVCRWHESNFDLETGEIRRWCTKLQEDGTSKGMEALGNISKNQRSMTMFPARTPMARFGWRSIW